jgi:tRNA uridine 5-carbamoylmethylation protein Kti12
MRTYETGQFEITFNGELVSVDVDWDLLTNYIVNKYKPSKHYVHNDETFFTIDTAQYDLDEFCQDMDDFCVLVDLPDEEMQKKIASLLAISSTKTKKVIYDLLGKIPRNVSDAGATEQPDIQKEQSEKPGRKKGTDGSLF